MAAKQILMTAVATLIGLAERLTGARPRATQALVLTPDDRLVLVRHSYIRGWYFPGGRLKRGEQPEDAIVRELREEIGLLSWQRISRVEPWLAGSHEYPLFLVEGAEYRFRPSLEIDAAREFDLDQLPEARQPTQKRMLAAWLAMREGKAGAVGA